MWIHRLFEKVAKNDGDQLTWVPQPNKPIRYVADEDRVVDKLIVTRLIRRYLEKDVLYVSQFARLFMDRYNLGEDEAKLLINDALRPLRDGGEVRRMDSRGKTVSRSSCITSLPEDTAGASILHNFLVSHLRRYLEGK